MNPHSSVNLLEEIFKQWNTHLDKQTSGITKQLIWVVKEQSLQNLFCVPCICMSLEMNIGETCSVFRGCLARDRKSPERGNVANVFGQRS